jgi:hypothetical protein
MAPLCCPRTAGPGIRPRSRRHLDLIDDEGVDTLVADHGRGVPEEHHRLSFDATKPAPQGGEAFELTDFLVPCAQRAGGE